MKRLIIFIVFTLVLGYSASAQTKIPAKDAAKHLNETLMVCDKVYGTKLIEASGMVLMDLGGAHPNQLLTVVIKGEDRGKFKDKPEEYFKGREICVTGKIIDYKGKPEIVVSDPADIKLELIDNTNKTPITN